jgi:hypothetical protein
MKTSSPCFLLSLLASVTIVLLLAGCKPKSAVSTATHDHLVTVDELRPYITNLYNRVSDLEAHDNTEWVAIDPDSKSYQQLWTPFGVLLVATKNVTPYLDGYKVKVAIGNPYNVTFSGFQLAYWCEKKEFTFEEAKTPVKPWAVFATPPLSSKETPKITTENRTETLYPGSWNELEFTVAPATADDIRRLRMAMHLNELILKENSASN